MTNTTTLIAGISLFLISQASFACDYPDRVNMPSGGAATKDEMLTGQKDVKAFVASMEAYLECIVEEEKLARLAMEDMQPEVEQQREEMLNKKYNAAVGEMEKVAAQFNTEVQEYKARDN